MRILRKSFRRHVELEELESTIAFYEQIQGATCDRRLHIEQARIDVAVIGEFIVLAGDDDALAPVRTVQATFTVDSLDEFVNWLPTQGAELLSQPKTSVAGRNATVRHPDGLVVEYFEAKVAQ